MMSQKRPGEGDSESDSVEKNKKFKMEASSGEMESSCDFVIMPWEDRTEVIVSRGNYFDKITTTCSRWELIQTQLEDSTTISNVDELISVIKSYNVFYEKDGKQSKPPWKFHILYQYFAYMDDCERNNFFKENGVLSTIRNLSLQLRKLVPRLKVLKTGIVSSVRLHQLQIASILANAFLCTFPKGKADCPSINFNTLYESSSGSVSNYCIEKIKCIVHYFRRIHEKQPTGNLSFHRLCIPDHKFPRWDKTTADLCSLKVDTQGKIEDQEGYLQMDFANRYVGGGVLGRGCVQEEIRFIICPELIAARLFTESLADNEAVFIAGAERYCQYRGYSNTFEFNGDYQDSTSFDDNRCRKTYLIVLDALYFHNSSEQYRESKILRELKKAYVGFKPIEESQDLPLATGNWGCGAFGGDPQLKSILQLMASSQARRDMVYLTFGDSVLKNQLEDLYKLLKERSVSVGMLYQIIRVYNKKRRNQTVFEFVRESIGKTEKQKFSQKSTTPVNSSLRATEFEFDFLNEDEISSMEEATKHKIDKRLQRNESYGNFPELDIDFDALDKEVQNRSGNSAEEKQLVKKYSSLPWAETKGDVPRESGNFLDTIWFENEVGCGSGSGRKSANSRKEADKVELDALRSSPSLFSDEDRMEESKQDERGTEKRLPQRNDLACVGVAEGRRSLQGRKMVQSKITDCFIKK